MKIVGRLIVLASVVGFTLPAAAGDYDFDYGDKNKMRGAWFMCSTTGFREGDCPEVFKKCWLPPMTYRKNHKTKTHCEEPPDFTSSQEDADKAHADAIERIQQGTPSMP